MGILLKWAARGVRGSDRDVHPSGQGHLRRICSRPRTRRRQREGESKRAAQRPRIWGRGAPPSTTDWT
eukprot:4294302-Pleurochrysis_carterae.AAC.1